jgi:hypothetical protein
VSRAVEDRRLLSVERTASNVRSRAAWREARTFADLCALAAGFVEGELDFFPGWNAPDLDAESDEIASYLARLCRAGFLTTASQPAREEQRAFVAGFAPPALALRLLRAQREADLVVVTFGAGCDPDAAHEREPVSLHRLPGIEEGIAHAFAGHDAREEEIACFEDHVTGAALDELRGQAWVSAHDRRWGRPDALWDQLLRAVADVER